MRAYTRFGTALVPEPQGIIEVRNRFWRAASSCRKVAAVLVGHQHAYARQLVDRKTPVGVYPQDDLDGHGVLDRFSPDPSFRFPLWQITAGNGGAPWDAYTPSGTPWTPEVIRSQEGYSLFEAKGEKLSMTVYSFSGQVIDRVNNLMAVKQK